MKKTIKAWAIFDTETKEIGRYFESYGDYMISAHKTPRRSLHKTYEAIPCTITYEA